MCPAHKSARVACAGGRPPAAHLGTSVRGLIACTSGIERGKMSLMYTPLIDPAEALAPFGDSDTIPLPDVGDYVGMTRDARNYAIRKGLIQTATGPGAAGRGRAGSYVVTRDEALLIIVAAALAAALGIAVITAIRTLRNSGASITAESVTIPLSGLKTVGKAS